MLSSFYLFFNLLFVAIASTEKTSGLFFFILTIYKLIFHLIINIIILNGGCKLTFLYIESPHKCILGSEVGVENTFGVKNCLINWQIIELNKRTLYTKNAVKDKTTANILDKH